jgi:hypothetical protein
VKAKSRTLVWYHIGSNKGTWLDVTSRRSCRQYRYTGGRPDFGLLCDRTLNVMPLKFRIQMAGNFIPKHCDVAGKRFQQIAARWSDSGNLQKFQAEDSCAMVRFWKLREVSDRRFQHGWKLPEVSGRRFQLEVRFWKLPQDSGSK